MSAPEAVLIAPRDGRRWGDGAMAAGPDRTDRCVLDCTEPPERTESGRLCSARCDSTTARCRRGAVLAASSPRYFFRGPEEGRCVSDGVLQRQPRLQRQAVHLSSLHLADELPELQPRHLLTRNTCHHVMGQHISIQAMRQERRRYSFIDATGTVTTPPGRYRGHSTAVGPACAVKRCGAAAGPSQRR